MSERHIGSRAATIGIVLALGAAASCSAPPGSQTENTVPAFPGSTNALNPTGPGGNAAPAGNANGTNPNGSNPSGTGSGPQTNEGNPNLGNVGTSTPPGGTPGSSGGAAPGGTPTDTMPPGTMPPGTMPPGTMPPGTMPPTTDPGTTPPVVTGPLPTARDLRCGNLNIAAADVISDFSTPTPLMYPGPNRGATTWLSYSATPASDPISAGNAFQVDANQSGPCNSGGALHVSSPGNTGYGVGFGINFKPDAAPGKRDLYNARADGLTGVGFFALCKQEVETAFIKFSDDATEAEVVTPQCSFDANSGLRLCRQYGIKNAVLMSNAWTHYEIFFDDTLLDTDANFAGTGLHSNALTAFQIQINSKANAQPNGFDCLIDDVHFLRAPTPRAPAPGNVTTVAGHTIAPGGFYTQGRQIFDSSGNVHIFKGFARPSMEFDPAGLGVTRDDVQRMWATGANVVRFAVSEGYWLSTHPQFNPNYQAYVDRAIQWTLQNDMAAIIDLHWSGNPAAQQQMAGRDSITFWQQVANKYKGDGRVIFELYNEPHDVSNAIWRNGGGNFAGMQQMYDAIRAAGANNLVLAGGLDFANDLDSLLPAMQLTGINIAYVTHPYRWKNPPSGYDGAAATFPVFATEFGDAAAGGIGPQDCGTAAYSNAINDFTRMGVSWTSWAWTVAPERCAFPALLDKYDGTPTPPGRVVLDALRN